MTPEVPSTTVYWVIASLGAISSILLAITAWFASRMAHKVDSFPVELAKAHARISKHDERLGIGEFRLTQAERSHDNLSKDYHEHLRDHH